MMTRLVESESRVWVRSRGSGPHTVHARKGKISVAAYGDLYPTFVQAVRGVHQHSASLALDAAANQHGPAVLRVAGAWVWDGRCVGGTRFSC